MKTVRIYSKSFFNEKGFNSSNYKDDVFSTMPAETSL